MRKFMVTLIAAMLVAVGVQAATTSPASADNGRIYHFYPDTGYDPNIRIMCDNGTVVGLPEAIGSWQGGWCPGGTKGIYIRPGEDLWCKYVYSENYTVHWVNKMEYDGWHWIGSSFSDGLGCTLRTEDDSN